MSLDLTYSLTADFSKNDFKNLKKTELIDISKNYISIYYPLNWSGVSAEEVFLIGHYLFSKLNSLSKKDLEDNKLYLVKNDNNHIYTSHGISLKEQFNIKAILSTEDCIRFLNKTKKWIKSPLDLLSFSKWKGNNGEEFSYIYKIKRDSKFKNKRKKSSKLKVLELAIFDNKKIKENPFNEKDILIFSLTLDEIFNKKEYDNYLFEKSNEVLFILNKIISLRKNKKTFIFNSFFG